MKKFVRVVLFFLMALSCSAVVFSGNIDSPGDPSLGSGMVTDNDLYNYLIFGAEPIIPGSFQEPMGPPGSTMHSTQEIYTDIKDKFDQCDAEPHEVLSGVEYFSTNPADWGPRTGTATGGSCPYPAPVEKTGFSISDEPGDDGAMQKGVGWPNPRFTDNGNGTVRDNLTGLIWLKNANCFSLRTWSQALSDCNTLENGACGLTDGSSDGDWRLPNRKELDSLIHLGLFNPALSNTAGTGKWVEGDPFSGVQINQYWSSTPGSDNMAGAWTVGFDFGYVFFSGKTFTHYVWPVRGGQ